jgi:hypothetical protein
MSETLLRADEIRTLEREIGGVREKLAPARAKVSETNRQIQMDMQRCATARLKVFDLEADLLAKTMRLADLRNRVTTKPAAPPARSFTRLEIEDQASDVAA